MDDHLPPDLADAVVAAELALMDPVVRASPERLDALLHPEFREIGASGTLWTREAIIRAMLDEPADGPTHEVAAIVVRRIAADLLQLTYQSRSSSGRSAARSSIWVETSDGLRILFHQGTLTPDRGLR